MKVAFAENNVQGSQGLQQSAGFQIRAGAHAFKMLSSGLYSDKVRAVLREIGCNAVDAHIAGKCPDRPIRVKLPGALDDQFYIQDWGPGLSHEDTMGLYSTYFASTKQESNDFTGAFGLGSKSPFSYTDSFTVVSTHGGVKRTYSLYLNNHGEPTTSLMAEEAPDPDWNHGVRVGFAVRPGDYNEFSEKAQDVYKWFRVTPEIKGSKPIVPVDYRYTCEDYSLVKGGPRDYIIALMGNVAYPIDLKQLGIQDVNDANAAKDLLNYAKTTAGLVLRLDIGTVQVAASREQLQYDPASLLVLQEKARLSMRRAGKEVVALMEAAIKGGWKDLCKATETIDTVFGGSGLKYHFDGFAAAVGVKASLIPILAKYIGKEEVPVPAMAGDKTAAKLVRAGRYTNKTAVRIFPVHGGQTIFGTKANIEIHPDTVIAVGLCDFPGGRAKRAIEEGKYHQIIVLGKGAKIKPLLNELTDESVAVARALGNMEIIDLNTLPPPDPQPGMQKRKKKGKKYVPTLPVGISFPGYEGLNKVTTELGDIDPVFMCYYTKSRWGNNSVYARVLKGTLEDDIAMEWSDWDVIWHHYAKLQAKLKLPFGPMTYAKLTVQQIRSFELIRMGWRSTWDVIGEYLKQPPLRQALALTLKKKHLIAAANVFVSGGWMTGMACMRGDPAWDSAAEPLLAAAGLTKQLDDMLSARRALDKKGTFTPDVPEEIKSYQYLVSRFRMDDELAKDVAGALTVEDLDAAFVKRFPLAAFVDHKTALSNPTTAVELLKFILSKETP